MNGGQAAVKALEDQGVRYVFGIPGVHDLPVYDALYESKKIRHVLARHEQGAAYMADGYARAGGTTGVSIVAAGPGALNTLAAVSSAYLDSQPLLVISGGINSNNWGKGAIHEFDQLSMFTYVTKRSTRPTGPRAIYQTVSEAFALTNSDRPRPVFVELPFNLQAAESGAGRPKRAELHFRASERAVAEAAGLVSGSTKVAILAGGGVISADACREIRELASLLKAPVASTILGKGALDERDPLSAGWVLAGPGRSCVEDAGLVLALGCRFSERSTAAWSIKIGSLIHVDIDHQELNRNYKATLAVQGDVRDFTRRLVAKLGKRVSRTAASWYRRPKESPPTDSPRSEGGALSPKQAIGEIVDVLPRDTVLVVDTGYAFWNSVTLFKASEPRRYLCSAGNAAMGYALPASIGAKLARPGENVVALVGDGSMMMVGEELAVATELGLDLTVVVLNDGGYGSIRDYQRTGYGKRYIAVDFENPDYVRFAEAHRAMGFVAEKRGESGEAVRRAISRGGVNLIEIKLNGQESMLPSFLTGKYGKK
jgi:acetolactate synthase I/II/III large subunit